MSSIYPTYNLLAWQYLLKYVPSSYQLKEPLANPKDIRCRSSITGFLFQLASHLGQLAVSCFYALETFFV